MNHTMLYKFPGSQEIHGGHFDYIIVEEDEIEAKQAEGWSLTTTEAKAAHEAAVQAEQAAKEAEAERLAALALNDETKPPTREELERMAESLGLPFTSRTTDKKLGQLIAAATSTDAAPAA